VACGAHLPWRASARECSLRSENVAILSVAKNLYRYQLPRIIPIIPLSSQHKIML
jgi:hypothetical protein